MFSIASFAFLLFLYGLLVHASESNRAKHVPRRPASAMRPRSEDHDEGDWSNPQWQRYGESLLDFKTKIVGVKHKNPDGTSRQKILSHCQVGEQLFLIRDPDNPVDENAVKICREDGTQIGFLSEFRAAQVAPVLDRGFVYAVTIQDLNQGPSGEIGCNLSLVTMGRGRVRALESGREVAVVTDH